MNQTNLTTDYACYEATDDWYDTLDSVRFWIESVALPTIGFLGILGNLLVILVLIRLNTNQKENKNRQNFDRLLISLSITDTLLLVMYITDALVQASNSYEPSWYQVDFINVVNYSFKRAQLRCEHLCHFIQHIINICRKFIHTFGIH